MTIQGIIVLIFLGFALLLWILNLVRRDKLYVGYGVIFVIIIVNAMLILAIPALLTFITGLVGAVFPASALTLLAICFIVFMLVYILMQVTLISNRLAAVIQQMAIQQAKELAESKHRQEGSNVGGNN
jgi:hypothetical protein